MSASEIWCICFSGATHESLSFICLDACVHMNWVDAARWPLA